MSDENNKTNLPTLGVREDLYKKSYLKRYETQQDILDKLVQKQAQNSPGFTLSSKKEDGKYVFHRDYGQNDLTDDQKKTNSQYNFVFCNWIFKWFLCFNAFRSNDKSIPYWS